jgi:hypothetical protein
MVKYGLDCKFGNQQEWGKPQTLRYTHSWIWKRHEMC